MKTAASSSAGSFSTRVFGNVGATEVQAVDGTADANADANDLGVESGDSRARWPRPAIRLCHFIDRCAGIFVIGPPPVVARRASDGGLILDADAYHRGSFMYAGGHGRRGLVDRVPGSDHGDRNCHRVLLASIHPSGRSCRTSSVICGRPTGRHRDQPASALSGPSCGPTPSMPGPRDAARR